jgi:hypothetical protein
MWPPRPGEVVRPDWAINTLTASLNKRGRKLPKPMNWLLNFTPGGPYAVSFDGAQWSAKEGDVDNPDVVVATSPEVWATFLTLKRDERRRHAQTMQIAGSSESVEEFLRTLGAGEERAQRDSERWAELRSSTTLGTGPKLQEKRISTDRLGGTMEQMEEHIKDTALDMGYEACGIIKVSAMSDFEQKLNERIERVPEANPLYQNCHRFAHPEATYPWAKSIIVCVVNQGRYKVPDNLEGLIGKHYLFDCRTDVLSKDYLNSLPER